jgi:hypothetical protein
MSGPGATTEAPAGTSMTPGGHREQHRTHRPRGPAMTGGHSIADLLTLVGAIRRIAFDVTLEAGDALRRIRDLHAE